MNSRQTLFKFFLLLGIPLVFCGAAVSVPHLSRAQTNQSDTTGPMISNPGGITNQSDSTGLDTTTNTTTNGNTTTTTSTTTTTTENGSITVTTTTITTTTGVVSSNSPQLPDITLENNAGGATTVPSGTTPAQPTPGQPGATSTGGGQPQQPTPPVQAQTTVMQTVDVAFGPERMFLIVPPVSSRLMGSAMAMTLGAFSNLGANAGNISILSAWSWGSWGGMLVRIGSSRIILTLSGISPGGSQNNPVLPGGIVGGSFTFIGVITGAWFDPPTAEGFRYTMSSDSLFTKILDFPKGLGDRFTVTVGDESLGEFGPGQEVDFSRFPGGGVKEFTVTGISPLADPEDPVAFPLKLAFNTEKADFMMTPIENPEAVAWYQENPPAEKPLQISILSPEGRQEVEPTSTAQLLQENAALLSSSLQDEGQARKLTAAVTAVNKHLQSLGNNFQTLLPEGGGMNMAGLNPTMSSMRRLQGSLPSLLASLSDLDQNGSPEQTAAVTEMLQEVEGMTLLLEAMTPMLNEMSKSVAIAK